MTLLAVALLAARALTLMHAAWVVSVSYDEAEYVYSGFRTWHAGDWSVNPHPPLAKVLAGLPVVLAGASATPDKWDADPKRLRTAWADARLFIHRNPTATPRQILFPARLPTILLWLLLGWCVFCWSRELYGERGGLLSLGLFLTCPTLAGLGQIVGTDLPCVVFATLALWRLARCWGAPRPAAVAGVGLLLGLSAASRVQGLLIALVALLGVLLACSRNSSEEGPLAPASLPPRELAGRALIAAACAVVGLASAYAFHPGWIPHYWEGATFHSNVYYGAEGHDLYYLDGRYSDSGWWDYFPRLVAYKLSPWRLVLLLIGLAAVLRSRPRAAEWLLLAPAAAAFLAAVASGINYSFRHILLIWPLLYILAGRLASRAGTWGLVLLVAAVAGDGVESARVHPHYQAYASPVIGGAAQAYRRIADNTLDAGQGLGDLDARLQAMGDPDVFLAYFGQGDPNAPAYRIRYRALPMRWHAADLVIHEPAGVTRFPRYVVVSAFYLQTYGRGIYHWLLQYEPQARPGYSILLYDREGRPEFLAYLAYSYVDGALEGAEETRVRSLSQLRISRAVELLKQLRRERGDGWETARPWIEGRLDERPETRLWFCEALRLAGWRVEAREQVQRLIDRAPPQAILREARRLLKRLDRG